MTITNLVPRLVNETPSLLGEDGKANLSEVQRQTGLNYRTVRDWYHNRITRTDFEVYDKWCKFFGRDVLVWDES